MNLKSTAIDIFRSALDSVLPENFIPKNVKLDESGTLHIKNISINLKKYRSVHMLGCGKASLKMASSFEKIMGKYIKGGIIVTNKKTEDLKTVKVVQSSHPIPDHLSLKAAKMVESYLSKLKENDLFIFLLSGGASSLMEKPSKPFSIKHINEINTALIKSGADIREVNTVRKHLSGIKGGKLAWITRSHGIVIVLSDVVGDDLETIGSAPLYMDSSTIGDAVNTLKKYSIAENCSWETQQLLKAWIKYYAVETPKKPKSNITHVIIANNKSALEAARTKAENYGFNTMIFTSMLEGEAREAAKVISSIVKEVLKYNSPLKKPCCLLFGGETTVTVKGDGIGGRNQELCLSALKQLAGTKHVAMLSAGTDGIDGNSEAAGAVIAPEDYGKDAILEIDRFLENNDSGSFFKKYGTLIETGATGTNVMDITIALAGGENDR